ncbi:hypothetical protein AMK14_01420 [Streptomyces sp. TSRI0445]|uniref:Uncharacterized protein n=1 Tax=Streptomyces globisporus TaxID=1908 RepID=A0ABM9GPH9_STRGL|nr:MULTISPECIES: hypothetical protein [Streptomyces]AVO00819.1 May20 [Streptomyces sp.]OKI72006.1 hypothetical protein AMK14_01420 [Streptomyces sp. TSRI0445]UIZ15598.1 hypothetical protein LZ559_26040 [Streptomyces sp. R527F]WSU80745.1 hypothetical protein OG215_08885 [Streptomyces globisporus]CAH9413298.1 hypothetical protein SGL43_00296 [Streptomyces globisporus]
MHPRTRLAGTVLAGALLTASLATAPTALATSPAPAPAAFLSPAGCWNAQAAEGDMPPADVKLEFRTDRSVKLIGPPDENGTPYFVGHGTWTPGWSGSFRFTVEHPLPGGPPGEARSALNGKLSSSKAFAAKGETHYFYDDGTTGGPSSITITGTRAACS